MSQATGYGSVWTSGLTKSLDIGLSPSIDEIPEVMCSKDVTLALDNKQDVPELSFIMIHTLGTAPPAQSHVTVSAVSKYCVVMFIACQEHKNCHLSA